MLATVHAQMPEGSGGGFSDENAVITGRGEDGLEKRAIVRRIVNQKDAHVLGASEIRGNAEEILTANPGKHQDKAF
ncbi:hypothetical protein W02_35150 [Nitrospira sp. KM1]|nr:hypothetical protein W02_35150 [Nitrospira sp. KM1]